MASGAERQPGDLHHRAAFDGKRVVRIVDMLGERAGGIVPLARLGVDCTMGAVDVEQESVRACRGAGIGQPEPGGSPVSLLNYSGGIDGNRLSGSSGAEIEPGRRSGRPTASAWRRQ